MPHFRAEALRALGGWDAWNVAEDADLGFRLARAGLRTRTFAATTREEAPTAPGNWLRQRRRWTKGWMQTAVVLARSPRMLARELGAWRLGILALLFTGLVGGPLATVPLTFLTVMQLWAGRAPETGDPLALVRATLWGFVFVSGATGTVWAGFVGARQRRLRASLPLLLGLLPYQLLIGIAAWGGLADLVLRPHHWHKTRHGTTRPTLRAPTRGHPRQRPRPPRAGR